MSIGQKNPYLNSDSIQSNPHIDPLTGGLKQHPLDTGLHDGPKPPPAIEDTVWNLSKGLVSGTLGTIKSGGQFAEAVADVTKNDWLRVQAKNIQGSVDPILESGAFGRSDYTWGEDPIGRAAYAIGSAFPSLAPAVALNLVPGVGGALSLSYIAAIEGGGEYSKARDAGLSVDKAASFATLAGLGSAFLEKIPLDVISRGAAPTLKRYLYGLQGPKGLRAYDKTFSKIPGWANKTLPAGVLEGTEEVVQDAYKTVLGAAGGYDNLQNLTRDWLDSFVGGFGAGAALGGIVNAPDGVRYKLRAQGKRLNDSLDVMYQANKDKDPAVLKAAWDTYTKASSDSITEVIGHIVTGDLDTASRASKLDTDFPGQEAPERVEPMHYSGSSVDEQGKPAPTMDTKTVASRIYGNNSQEMKDLKAWTSEVLGVDGKPLDFNNMTKSARAKLTEAYLYGKKNKDVYKNFLSNLQQAPIVFIDTPSSDDVRSTKIQYKGQLHSLSELPMMLQRDKVYPTDVLFVQYAENNTNLKAFRDAYSTLLAQDGAVERAIEQGLTPLGSISIDKLHETASIVADEDFGPIVNQGIIAARAMRARVRRQAAIAKAGVDDYVSTPELEAQINEIMSRNPYGPISKRTTNELRTLLTDYQKSIQILKDKAGIVPEMKPIVKWGSKVIKTYRGMSDELGAYKNYVVQKVNMAKGISRDKIEEIIRKNLENGKLTTFVVSGLTDTDIKNHAKSNPHDPLGVAYLNSDRTAIYIFKEKLQEVYAKYEAGGDLLSGVFVPITPTMGQDIAPPILSKDEFTQMVMEHEFMHAIIGVDGSAMDEALANLLALERIGRRDIASLYEKALNQAFGIKSGDPAPAKQVIYPEANAQKRQADKVKTARHTLDAADGMSLADKKFLIKERKRFEKTKDRTATYDNLYNRFALKMGEDGVMALTLAIAGELKSQTNVKKFIETAVKPIEAVAAAAEAPQDSTVRDLDTDSDVVEVIQEGVAEIFQDLKIPLSPNDNLIEIIQSLRGTPKANQLSEMLLDLSYKIGIDPKSMIEMYGDNKVTYPNAQAATADIQDEIDVVSDALMQEDIQPEEPQQDAEGDEHDIPDTEDEVEELVYDEFYNKESSDVYDSVWSDKSTEDPQDELDATGRLEATEIRDSAFLEAKLLYTEREKLIQEYERVKYEYSDTEAFRRKEDKRAELESLNADRVSLEKKIANLTREIQDRPDASIPRKKEPSVDFEKGLKFTLEDVEYTWTGKSWVDNRMIIAPTQVAQRINDELMPNVEMEVQKDYPKRAKANFEATKRLREERRDLLGHLDRINGRIRDIKFVSVGIQYMKDVSLSKKKQEAFDKLIAEKAALEAKMDPALENQIAIIEEKIEKIRGRKLKGSVVPKESIKKQLGSIKQLLLDVNAQVESSKQKWVARAEALDPEFGNQIASLYDKVSTDYKTALSLRDLDLGRGFGGKAPDVSGAPTEGMAELSWYLQTKLAYMRLSGATDKEMETELAKIKKAKGLSSDALEGAKTQVIEAAKVFSNMRDANITIGEAAKRQFEDAVMGFVRNVEMPKASKPEQQERIMFWMKFIGHAYQEIQQLDGSSSMKYRMSWIGSEHEFGSEQEAKDFSVQWLEYQRGVNGNKPGFTIDPALIKFIEKSRPQYAFWADLPVQLKRLVLFTKAKVEAPLRDMSVAVGAFREANVLQHQETGFDPRGPALVEPDASAPGRKKGSGELEAPLKPGRKFESRVDYVAQTERSGLVQRNDFAYDLGYWVADTLGAISKNQMLSLLKDIPLFTEQPPVEGEKVWMLVEYAEDQPEYKSKDKDVKAKVRQDLIAKGYKEAHVAPGLVKFFKGGWRAPYVHETALGVFNTMFDRDQGPFAVPNKINSVVKSFIMMIPNTFMGAMFSIPLVHNPGMSISEKIRLYFNPLYHPTKNALVQGLKHGRDYHINSKVSPANYHKGYDPVMLEKIFRNGVQGFNAKMAFASIMGEEADYGPTKHPFMVENTRKQWINLLKAKGGIDDYVFSEVIPQGIYAYYSSMYNHLLKKGASEAQAERAAADFVNRTAGTLAAHVYSGEKAFLSAMTFAADFTLSEISMFTGAVHGSGTMIEGWLDKLGFNTKGKITGWMNNIRGYKTQGVGKYFNGVLHGTVSDADMEILGPEYLAAFAKSMFVRVLMVNMFQYALSWMDDDEDERGKFAFQNAPGKQTMVRLPKIKGMENQFDAREYLDVLMFKEAGNFQDWFGIFGGKGAIKTLQGKGSFLLNTSMQLGSNEDFMGREIFKPDGNLLDALGTIAHRTYSNASPSFMRPGGELRSPRGRLGELAGSLTGLPIRLGESYTEKDPAEYEKIRKMLGLDRYNSQRQSMKAYASTKDELLVMLRKGDLTYREYVNALAKRRDPRMTLERSNRTKLRELRS